MSLDYKRHGFKCGIEIHQQLDTHKLFCNCPSIIRDDEPDIHVERKMRAVAGELGNVDPAALHEFLRDRTLLYQGYSKSTCLVELDDEPPHPLNSKALETVLEVALLLNARPVDEIHVMRKTVIDGSNTSGFQRTMLVAEEGFVETSNGRVGIPTICLEEDAARIIGTDSEDRIVYRIDRLGIPLVEIATTPDISSPEHAREVAEKIGSILRATEKVKRGLGTIRQDLNVSIAGGQRIEVKGVQNLQILASVVEQEVKRQMLLVDVSQELGGRGVNEKWNVGEKDFVDLTGLFKNSASNVIQKGISGGGVILGIRLNGFKNLLLNKLGPELAQYARASSSAKGIFHSDELPAYGITSAEVSAISKALGLGELDAFVIVCEDKTEAKKALSAVVNRCTLAAKGIVPEETRRAKEDGKSEYMRPLPGSSRMYPETDEPLVPVTKAMTEEISLNLPETLEEKEKRFVKEYGMSKELAGQIVHSPKASLVREKIKEFPGLSPTKIASVIYLAPKDYEKRYGGDSSFLNDSHYTQLLGSISAGDVASTAAIEIIAESAKNPAKPLNEIIKERGLGLMSSEALDELINKVMEEDPGEKDAGKVLGRVMASASGRADAKIVRRRLEEKLKQKKDG